MAFKKLWFWENGRLNDAWLNIAAFSTEEHLRPSVIKSSSKPSSEEPIWFGSLSSDGNLFMNWNDADVEQVPPLWYIFQITPRPFPNGPFLPCAFVHAMYGDEFEKGTVVESTWFTDRGIKPVSKRVGFVQWFLNDSKLQQIFVDPEWRRKRITLALFGIADLVIVAGELGPFLHGGDVTTTDGEQLRKAWSGSKRLDERIGTVGQIQIKPDENF